MFNKRRREDVYRPVIQVQGGPERPVDFYEIFVPMFRVSKDIK
jgi:hypothetical protein